MPAYVIAQMHVHDLEKYREYASKVFATLVDSGGRIVAANDIDVREGEAAFPRVVIGEFPTLDAARKWYESDAYQAVAPIRQTATTGVLFMVNGLVMPDQPHPTTGAP